MHVVASPDPRLDAFGLDEDAVVHPVKIKRAIDPLADALALANITKLLRRLAPDVVHASFPKAGLVGTMGAAAARVDARVYHMRGLRYESMEGKGRRLLWLTEHAACSVARRVLCNSHSCAEQAIADRVCSRDKILVIGSGSSNGVDARGHFDPEGARGARARIRERLDIPSDAIVYGFVGRVVRTKGVGELVQAWTTLRENPRAWLMVVGPLDRVDPIPDHLRHRIQVDGRTVMTGHVADTRDYYAAMDVVALPSYREGFPNTVLEAAAMCKPVVATDVTGCRDAVVDGVTGALVPVRSVEPLAAALRRYGENKALRDAHGAAARRRVLQEFEPQRIWQGYLDLYRELCAH